MSLCPFRLHLCIYWCRVPHYGQDTLFLSLYFAFCFPTGCRGSSKLVVEGVWMIASLLWKFMMLDSPEWMESVRVESFLSSRSVHTCKSLSLWVATPGPHGWVLQQPHVGTTIICWYILWVRCPFKRFTCLVSLNSQCDSMSKEYWCSQPTEEEFKVQRVSVTHNPSRCHSYDPTGEWTSMFYQLSSPVYLSHAFQTHLSVFTTLSSLVEALIISAPGDHNFETQCPSLSCWFLSGPFDMSFVRAYPPLILSVFSSQNTCATSKLYVFECIVPCLVKFSVGDLLFNLHNLV